MGQHPMEYEEGSRYFYENNSNSTSGNMTQGGVMGQPQLVGGNQTMQQHQQHQHMMQQHQNQMPQQHYANGNMIPQGAVMIAYPTNGWLSTDQVRYAPFPQPRMVPFQYRQHVAEQPRPGQQIQGPPPQQQQQLQHGAPSSGECFHFGNGGQLDVDNQSFSQHSLMLNEDHDSSLASWLQQDGGPDNLFKEESVFSGSGNNLNGNGSVSAANFVNTFADIQPPLNKKVVSSTVMKKEQQPFYGNDELVRSKHNNGGGNQTTTRKKKSGPKKKREKKNKSTSLEVFLKHINIVTDPETGKRSIDASGVLSRQCYEDWLASRKQIMQNAEECFRKTLISHITCSDGGSCAFDPDIEAAILQLVREPRIWDCFKGRVSTDSGKPINIGSKGLRTTGFHEKKALKRLSTDEEPMESSYVPKRRRARKGGALYHDDDFEYEN